MGRVKIFRLAVIALFLLLIRQYVLQPFRVFGISMEPVYRDGSIILVDKLVYRFRTPRRGEIVVFRTQDAPYLYFVKRVIALPQEQVEMKDGTLFINGRKTEEKYFSGQNGWNIEPFTVRKECVFVIGDNRSMPEDFHLFTQVAIKNIVGRVPGGR
ncbi:MAG TPA: signal peptidase I [bacterium]|nr:signal peptidase I [bacterium]